MRRFDAPLDLVLGDGDFLGGGVDEDQHAGGIFAAEEAGDDVAIFEDQSGVTKRGIDVAAGIEDIFDEPIGAARADAVELRADLTALAIQLMTRGAGGGEDLPLRLIETACCPDAAANAARRWSMIC